MRPVSGGIDFGTSNSTVGVVDGNAPQLLRLEGDSATLPSALFFNFDDDSVSVGRHAVAQYTDGVDGRLLRALKSVLGSSLVHEKTRIKKRNLLFSEIIGLFIARLKAKLDKHHGQTTEHVVLGRPVQFVDGDPTADRAAQGELERAARAQGFRHVEFQYEPIAAALDYEQQVSREEVALIVDMGGGTSDFSVVRVSPDGARKTDRRDDILANEGVHIGGTDFDRLLSIAYIMPALGYLTPTKDGKRNLPAGYFIDLATWHRIHRLYTSKALIDLRQIRYEAARPELVDLFIDVVEHRLGHLLATRVEDAKIALTDTEAARLHLDLTDARLDIGFTREQLEKTLHGEIARVSETARQALSAAGIAPADITAVFLTGGSTAIPLARQSLLSLVPQAKVVQGDAFGSVGIGLALDAARRFG
ncbi:MAG: Hsp70 family protein [Rhizobiaceae bacterium]